MLKVHAAVYGQLAPCTSSSFSYLPETKIFDHNRHNGFSFQRSMILIGQSGLHLCAHSLHAYLGEALTRNYGNQKRVKVILHFFTVSDIYVGCKCMQVVNTMIIKNIWSTSKNGTTSKKNIGNDL